MNKKLHWIYNKSPKLIQNLMVTCYNLIYNTRRYSGVYKEKKEYFYQWRYKNIHELTCEQEKRLTTFFKYVRSKSAYYQSIIPEKDIYKIEDLRKLPLMTKNDIVNSYNSRSTIQDHEGYVSYTGGTTGASLKVIYQWEDVQERRAFLDYFWEQYGYKRGNKIAWFSGKHIIPNEKTTNFWRNDWLNVIRYYSTFHITKKNVSYYIQNLNTFKPEFIVGFPSSVYQIVKLAKENGIKYNNKVKCFFPTAESLRLNEKEEIQKFFHCEVRDQYASSEGAPFITECPEGQLHYEMLTGIFELVDENNLPSDEGEILVTSFTTRGTPLIRYKIGDRIRFKATTKMCPCGQSTPIVDKIYGRTNDYILSQEHGKVNLGNISNCTKGVKGIIQFQLRQENRNEIIVLINPGKEFTKSEEILFKSNLQKTIGPSMKLILKEVPEITRENSGKFRIVVNKIES